VGVAGHRHDRLARADPELLTGRLREILTAIRAAVEEFGAGHAALFSDQPPAVRALTPLAEGTDRWFATAALDAGLSLCCPFPFSETEFERDFMAPVSRRPGSLEEFRALLARAQRESRVSRFEMDGDPERRPEAYATCGQVVVHQSDVLCVVWDGERRQLTGGTEHALDYAARRHVPIVLIDARAPHHWQIVRGTPSIPSSTDGADAHAPIAELRQLVSSLLQPPAAGHARGTSDAKSPGIDGFYQERWPGAGAGLGLPWSVFTRIFGGRVEPARTNVQSGDTWFEWPDRLAVFYATVYRSSFVVAYLLAALAVGMALLPLAFGWNVFEPHPIELLFIASELVMIGAILVIVSRGRTKGWHERWLEYRLAAELIRQVRVVAPLGGSRALPPTPWHASTYGHAGSTWMAWYARAVERDIGLPSASLQPPYLVACFENVQDVITTQSHYHADTATRSARIEKRLHLVGVTVLIGTLIAGALHVVAARDPLSLLARPPIVGSLIFMCGFLPALGAALAGIGNQAEVRRVAKRSEAMHRHFETLASRMRGLLDTAKGTPAAPQDRQLSVEVADVALRATELMINEVLDWRVVFIDRPLDHPA
jgi:hypothetical protein